LADEGAETHPDCLVEKIPNVGRIATAEATNLFDQSLRSLSSISSPPRDCSVRGVK